MLLTFFSFLFSSPHPLVFTFQHSVEVGFAFVYIGSTSKFSALQKSLFIPEQLFALEFLF